MTSFPTELKYTATQSRERAQSLLNVVGIPNQWWPYDYGYDCIAFVLFCLGVRTRTQTELKYISITEFVSEALKVPGWTRVTADEIRPGDIAIETWPVTGLHSELVYARVGNSLTTDAADTGPAPGVSSPRGSWHKTRTIDSWLLYGVRPPYKSGATAVTPSQRTQARITCTWLNHHLPAGCIPSGVGDIGSNPGDGITDPAPIYWHNVQTWCSQHDANGHTVERENSLYPEGFIIDGIPGPQTYKGEKVIAALAKKQ